MSRRFGGTELAGLFTAHQLEKLVVIFAVFEFAHQEFGGFKVVHRMEEFAQQPHALQAVVGNEHFFAAGAGFVDVDGREHAFFGHAAVEVQLHVAGAFEFFKNHVVHAAAGFHQRGGNDGERAAFFNVAGGAEEAFGAVQGVGVHTAAPFYFEYAPIKRNSRKTNAFKFHVVHKPELQEQIDHTKAKMQVSPRHYISDQERAYLMENFSFTEDGIRANLDLLKEYVKWFNLLGDVAIIKAKMYELERKGSTIGSYQGYLINSLKKKLAKVVKPSDNPISAEEEPTPKGSNRKPTAKELKEAKEAIAELSARTGFDFSRPQP